MLNPIQFRVNSHSLFPFFFGREHAVYHLKSRECLSEPKHLPLLACLISVLVTSHNQHKLLYKTEMLTVPSSWGIFDLFAK